MTRLLVAVVTTMVVLACTADDGHGPVPLDVTWTPNIAEPRYVADGGPLVVVDAAHGNWHTIDFRFAPFARLLEADGYRVAAATDPIDAASLEPVDIFVLANAVLGGEESVWVLPTPPALTGAEVDALVAWVDAGGALLLIADHMPFPASVETLAEQFGIVFLNGYAKPAFDKGGRLLFDRDNGLLVSHPIVDGRDASDHVVFVMSYTGQAFRLLDRGEPLLAVPGDWRVFLPADAFKPFTESTPSVSALGLYQGATLTHGAGRVAVFGEAAMFTAQAFRRPGGEVIRVGLNDPRAPHNARFVLNVMGWLSATSSQ